MLQICFKKTSPLTGPLTGLFMLTLSAAIIITTTPTHAFSEDKNWPCAQRKVEKLSAGQMWRGSPVDVKDTSWQTNDKITALTKEILPRRITLEQTNKTITKFASENKDNLEPLMKQTFLALLNETNQIRSEIIGGIGRFTKRQKDLAKRITTNRQKVTELEKNDEDGTLTKEQDKQLVALERSLEWDQRIHEEREQSLDFVCEAPVLLEQRLFALAKQLNAPFEKK